MDHDALIELQTRLMHQERAVEELNAALCEQRAELARLAARLEQVQDRVVALADAAPSPQDERPPHY